MYNELIFKQFQINYTYKSHSLLNFLFLKFEFETSFISAIVASKLGVFARITL